jgi:hypothetical protein
MKRRPKKKCRHGLPLTKRCEKCETTYSTPDIEEELIGALARKEV